MLRTDQYEYLPVLGLLAMTSSLGRSRDEWAPLPGRVVRRTLAVLPAYVLIQVVPLPGSLVRLLSPERAAAVGALDAVGAKLSFASLSGSPARAFQHFLLLCGYVIIFLLVRELTWRFGAAHARESTLHCQLNSQLHWAAVWSNFWVGGKWIMEIPDSSPP